MDQYRVFRMPAAGTGADRPTFLLLHGIGLSHRSFTPVAKILAGHGDVIALDLPGFGGARRPARPLSVEQIAAGVARVLDEALTGPVVVVGHSMGAQFALELTLMRPDLVTGVVMIGPVVDPRIGTLWQHTLCLMRDAILEPLQTNLMVQREYVRCGPVWFSAETRAMLAYPTHERIAGLTHPLLVLRGNHDSIASERWASWLGGRVPLGQSESTPRHRHNVVHSAPSDIAGRIVRFAGGLPAAP